MPSFKLIAKRDIHEQGKSNVVIGKGMTFECSLPSSPDSGNVKKAIKERYGVDVHINSASGDFEIIKL